MKAGIHCEADDREDISFCAAWVNDVKDNNFKYTFYSL